MADRDDAAFMSSSRLRMLLRCLGVWFSLWDGNWVSSGHETFATTHATHQLINLKQTNQLEIDD